MVVSKSLLNNFAKLIDTKDKTKPTLEFNATILDITSDGYYRVAMGGNLASPESTNLCLCTSQVDNIQTNDTVRLKIQNGEATIIQKY